MLKLTKTRDLTSAIPAECPSNEPTLSKRIFLLISVKRRKSRFWKDYRWERDKGRGKTKSGERDKGKGKVIRRGKGYGM